MKLQHLRRPAAGVASPGLLGIIQVFGLANTAPDKYLSPRHQLGSLATLADNAERYKMDYSPLFSIQAKTATRSVIREILKLTQKPEIISFAGGLPAPDTFPVDILTDIVAKVLKDQGPSALQYGLTEGDPRLREEIQKWIAADGVDTSIEEIVITNGSQQGLDLTCRVLLNPGDTVIVELPSYLGGLQTFRASQANIEGVLQDEGGLRMDLLEEKLEDLASRGIRPKFIYVVPDFQNPSGVTMDNERRVRLLELAAKFDTLILEDTPYRQLRFSGQSQTPLYSLDKDGRVITLNTFSKLFCPGFRLAWLLAPPALAEKIIIAKQSTDLCTPPFNQAVMAQYMAEGRLGPQVESIKKEYKEKGELMLNLLDEHMPEGIQWTRPEGGLFLWVMLKQGMDSLEMLEKYAIPRNVAYVIGSAFYCDGGGANTMRLNFSFPTIEQIREGVPRLAQAIGDYLSNQ